MSNPFETIAKKREEEGHKALARRIRIEGRMASALVQTGLDRGYLVSVFDSEEWTLKGSTDKTAIMNALFTTDEDTIRFSALKDGKVEKVGAFFLIYGNDGTDVISDYTANDACEAIWTEVIQPLADKIDAGR